MLKVKFYRSNIISLFALGFFSLSVMLMGGYINNWSTHKTSFQKYIDPNTFVENIILTLPNLFPILFILWMLFVNRWQRSLIRISFYSGLFFSYLIAVVVVGGSLSILSETILDYLGIKSNLSIPIAEILLILITTLFNYFLSIFERKRLKKKDIWIWMILLGIIPLFSFVWGKFLTLFMSGAFVDSWISNGGVVFSFIIYEGFFYLWLKDEIELSFYLQ